MVADTSSRGEFLESRFADSVDYNGGRITLLPVARVVSVDAKARAWRVTLERVERRDRAAFNAPTLPGNSSLLVPSQGFTFTAGFQNTPQIPPRRANPIFGPDNPGSGADVEPMYVQIGWGMNQGRTARMLANWPLQGGSVVVEGAYVEVFAATQGGGGTPPPVVGSFPNFAAHITPWDGPLSRESNELSLTQQRPLPSAIVGSLAEVIMSPAGLGAAGDFAGSAVYNTAPFSGYTSIIGALSPFTPRPINIVFFTAATVPQFQLLDNQVPNGAGVFVPSPGNVGIVYRTDGVTGVHTLADMDALINTSTIIHTLQNSTNPTFKMFAGYTVTGAAPFTTGLATAVIGAPTQGAAVYVPDFARRVRVQPITQDPRFAGIEFRATMPPPLIFVNFYDDSGLVVESVLQGGVADINGDPDVLAPYDWIAIPAPAVMMAVYPFNPGTNSTSATDSVNIHWRIAP